jgi:hypothetical protein
LAPTARGIEAFAGPRSWLRQAFPIVIYCGVFFGMLGVAGYLSGGKQLVVASLILWLSCSFLGVATFVRKLRVDVREDGEVVVTRYFMGFLYPLAPVHLSRDRVRCQIHRFEKGRLRTRDGVVADASLLLWVSDDTAIAVCTLPAAEMQDVEISMGRLAHVYRSPDPLAIDAPAAAGSRVVHVV